MLIKGEESCLYFKQLSHNSQGIYLIPQIMKLTNLSSLSKKMSAPLFQLDQSLVGGYSKINWVGWEGWIHQFYLK